MSIGKYSVIKEPNGFTKNYNLSDWKITLLSLISLHLTLLKILLNLGFQMLPLTWQNSFDIDLIIGGIISLGIMYF